MFLNAHSCRRGLKISIENSEKQYFQKNDYVLFYNEDITQYKLVWIYTYLWYKEFEFVCVQKMLD